MVQKLGNVTRIDADEVPPVYVRAYLKAVMVPGAPRLPEKLTGSATYTQE